MARKKKQRTTARLNRNQRKRIRQIAETQGERAAKQAKQRIVARNKKRISGEPQPIETAPEIIQEQPEQTVGPEIADTPADTTDYVGQYEDWLYSTLNPEFEKFKISATAGDGLQFKTVDDFASGYLERDSEFYNNRVRRETEDLDKALAARGLFNSGAALEQNRELISTIRGEETERAYDLASKDASLYNQTILSNQQQSAANLQGTADRMKSLIENELRRQDGLDQADIDNLLRATDLFFAQSPLTQGYDAAKTTGQNTISFGNNLANNTQQNYQKVVPNLVSAPAPVNAPPTLDNTASIIAQAEADAANLIGKANNNATEAGNNAITGGNIAGIAQALPGIIETIGGLF